MITDQNDKTIDKAGLKISLVEAGASRYDLMLPETSALTKIIKHDEEIKGIVYGHYRQMDDVKTSRGALVATDRRVILIDKKPLFKKFAEITYPVISGIRSSKAGRGTTLTLHTRIGNISMSTLNSVCAEQFIRAIEEGVFGADQDYIN